MLNPNIKKGIIGPVISVFVMVLVISILAGLTFLFVTQLKSNVEITSDRISVTEVNETGWLNSTGYTLAKSTQLGFISPSINHIYNYTGLSIPAGNYTLVGNVLYNLTGFVEPSVNITYTYSYISERTAYEAVNDTESAGSTITSYLSLIFLAIIFGAILTLVLRIILPYINLGQQMGRF